MQITKLLNNYKLITSKKLMSSTQPRTPHRLSLQHEMIKEPYQYGKRHCTDILCLVVGLLFSAILIILSLIVFNQDTYTKTSLPSDSQGKVCGIDYASYSIIYFANPNDMSQRLCVSACPSSGDTRLQCTPAGNLGCRFTSLQGFSVSYYDNELVSNTNGAFCMPTDPTLRVNLENQAKLTGRNVFFNSVDVMGISLLIALGLSILYLILVQFFPRIMSQVAVYLGLVICLVLAILTYVYQSDNTTAKIVIGTILAVITLVVLCTIICHRASVRMCGVFLEASTKFVSSNPAVLIYIPIFMAFLTGFIFLILSQYKSFLSSGDTSFDPSTDMYYEVSGFKMYFLSTLLIIQAIWGLFFIKEAFNFCVSGNAVWWYLGKNTGLLSTFKLLICKHLGSVIASSFMNAFFLPIDFIHDLLKPSDEKSPINKFLCCTPILDLVRSDSMTYINLSGNPFCNSAHYCEYLCHESFVMDQSQSTNRTYRLCAHLLIAGIVTLISLYIKGEIQIYTIGVIALLCVFVSTFFISLHADASEAIQIMVLCEQEFSKRSGPNDKKQVQFERIEDRTQFLKSATAHPGHEQLFNDVAAIRKEEWKIHQ